MTVKVSMFEATRNSTTWMPLSQSGVAESSMLPEGQTKTLGT